METTIEAHPAIPAVFHPDCAHWLTLFAGRHLRALTNWLYWYPHTEEALQSLHLCGPSGTGKSMLTAALAQFYGGKFCAFDRVDTPYSPELLSTALVVLDETTTAKRPFEIFRALVSNPARVIKPRSDTPANRAVINDLIAYRYSYSVPTIITSNLDPDELKARYKNRIS